MSRGPTSCIMPRMLELPGPPLSHSTTGALSASARLDCAYLKFSREGRPGGCGPKKNKEEEEEEEKEEEEGKKEEEEEEGRRRRRMKKKKKKKKTPVVCRSEVSKMSITHCVSAM